MAEKTCERCGKGYRVKASEAAGSRYCSRRCKHGPSATKNCATCGNPYDAIPSKTSRRRYCSLDCYRARASTKIEKVCEKCGRAFLVEPAKATERKYCSDECFYHGRHCATGTPEYRAFQGAKGRCSNPKNTSYRNYGGRGIEFRFDSFEDFFAELGPRPSAAHSVDRINNDGHYEPRNLRWATRSVQNSNKRRAEVSHA